MLARACVLIDTLLYHAAVTSDLLLLASLSAERVALPLN